MCGIVGAAGALEYRDKDALQMLMHFAELRGEDSTGYFTVPKGDREATSLKVVGPTRTMFDTVGWDRLQISSKRAFVGHCRKATVGAVKRSTAHPFTYGSITGVHNGTLRNYRYLPGDTLETDSMTLYDNFSRVGVRPTLEATDGAYALIWWDEADETLNVVRNKERPLFYAFSDDYKKIFWASEGWMLNIALAKAGIKVADLTPKKDDPYTPCMKVEVDTWWKMKLGGVGAKDPITFLKDADGHTEEMKGGVTPAKYVAPPFQASTYRAPWIPHGRAPGAPAASGGQALVTHRLASPAATARADASTTTSSSTSDTSPTASDSPTKDSRPSKPTLSLVADNKSVGSDTPDADLLNDDVSGIAVPVIVGYNGLMLNEAEYDALVDPNCGWCYSPLSFADIRENPLLVGDWTDEDSFICKKCCDNMEGYQVGAFSR